jgi:hypothetical protein
VLSQLWANHKRYRRCKSPFFASINGPVPRFDRHITGMAAITRSRLEQLPSPSLARVSRPIGTGIQPIPSNYRQASHPARGCLTCNEQANSSLPADSLGPPKACLDYTNQQSLISITICRPYSCFSRRCRRTVPFGTESNIWRGRESETFTPAI